MSKVTYKGAEIAEYKPKKKKYWWRYLLTWFGGFLGAFLVLGVAGVIFGTVVSAKQALNMFGANADAILQPYYQGLSILQLATSLPSLKYETLGDIYQVTPLARSLIEETINPLLEKELHFTYNWDIISTKPFKLPVSPREGVDTNEDLSTYIGRAIKEGVYLKDFIKGNNLPRLVNLFLYPKNPDGTYDTDHPYSLSNYINGGDTFFNNMINSIQIKDAITNSDMPLINDPKGIGDWHLNEFTITKMNSLPLSLFIDKNVTDPLMVELRDNFTVGDLKEGKKFDTLSLGLFIKEDPTNELTTLLRTWTIGKIKKEGISINDFNDLHLSSFIDTSKVPESMKDLMGEISKWQIKDLTSGNKFDELSLGLFLNKSSTDPLIQELSKWTVGSLKDESNFSNIGLDKIVVVNEKTPKILLTLINKGYTIGQLRTADFYNDLTVNDVFDVSQSTVLEALKGKSLSDLQKESTIMNLKLGEVLPTTSTGSLVYKFKDKTLSELKNLDTFSITLGEIYTDEEIAANNILKALGKETKIGELSDPNTLNKLHLGDVFTDTSDPIVNALKDYKIYEIPSKINTLKLSSIIKIDEEDPNTPKILVALKDETIQDIPNKINTLTLGTILNINKEASTTTQLMKTIADKTIPEMNSFLSNITLGDVMVIDGEHYPDLNTPEVKNTKINDIDGLISVLKNHLKLKDVIDINEKDPNTPVLLVTLKDKYLKDIPGIINTLTLGQLIKIDGSSHPLLIALQGVSLSDFEAQIPTLTLGQILTISGTSHPLLQALQYTELQNLESTIPTLTLGNILTIDDDSSPMILRTLKDTQIQNFASTIKDLTLDQLVEINATDPNTPQILLALKGIKILDGTSLVAKINTLKLKDIYRESDCVGVFKYIWDDNDDGDLLITKIPSAVNNLPLTKILEEYMYVNDVTLNKYYDVDADHYYTYAEYEDGDIPSGHEVIVYRRISPIYWFLLTDSSETFTSEEKYYVLKNGLKYTINNGLKNLTSNFTYHMQTEKLYELYDSGVLDNSVLARTDLDKQFVDPNTHTTRVVGNLTMSEFLSICIQLLPSVPNP